MSRTEFTIINSDQCEVMVNIDIKTGKVVGLYCYADNIPLIEDVETGREYKVRTKPGLNPLFVHIQSRQMKYIQLLKNGYIFLTDDQDPEYNNEIKLIEKSILFAGANIANIY